MGRNIIHFLGITTGGSAVRKVFPAWMGLLGIDAELTTTDLPAGSSAASYRDFFGMIRDDPAALGAVITAHKTAVYGHAADLFTYIDQPSHQFEEISVVSRNARGLDGTVVEPKSITTTLEQMGGRERLLGPDRDVAIFGAGGTAVSLLAVLSSTQWPTACRPRQVHLVDVSLDRLQHAYGLATSGENPLQVEMLHSPGSIQLSDLGQMPDGSLIINATGLGKDKPGTPFALPARWPHAAHVWDLNYRGELLALEEARNAAPEKNLTAHDGWLLFINGWAEALSRIFNMHIHHELRGQMNQLAQEVRNL